jgi:thymidylate synthase ThyX
VREIRHVIEMRASEAADAEIRLMADELLELMIDEIPAYFSDYDLSVPKDGIGLAVHTEHPKV